MTLMPAHDLGHLDTKRLGKCLWSFPRLDSTNTLALSVAHDPANDGLVLLAQEQTSGRGQYGRVWTAPPGSSVLLSVLIFPPLHLRRPALLTAWTAVSVCETIREVAGLQATIKWPNDVLIDGKKVCGILIEQRNTGRSDFPLVTAVGIGLNVLQSADFFAHADLPLGGSLATLSGKELETRGVAECLIKRLDLAYDRLLQGEMAAIEGPWRERLGLVGQSVVIEIGQQKIKGRLLELSFTEVVVEDKGQIIKVQPEMVRHIVAAAL